jgi:transcriptional regulator with XRE-family HTH domain
MTNNTLKLNCLRLYRRKNGLSQKRAAYFLGLKTASPLSHYERGDKVPSLRNALKLEIVLHTPVAFLFRELYKRSKGEIRGKIGET